MHIDWAKLNRDPLPRVNLTTFSVLCVAPSRAYTDYFILQKRCLGFLWCSLLGVYHSYEEAQFYESLGIGKDDPCLNL